MKDKLEEYIARTEAMPLEAAFFHGDSRFSLRADDYSIRKISSFSPEFSFPEGMIFDKHYSNYGLVLTAPRKEKRMNCAILGFNIKGLAIDCVYIAGGRKRYRELSPVKWDIGLCHHAIGIAEAIGVEEFRIVPGYLIQGNAGYHGSRQYAATEGNDPIRHGRLNKRYDDVAKHFRMEFDPCMERYILRL